MVTKNPPVDWQTEVPLVFIGVLLMTFLHDGTCPPEGHRSSVLHKDQLWNTHSTLQKASSVSMTQFFNWALSLIPHESVFLRVCVCFPVCCCPPLPPPSSPQSDIILSSSHHPPFIQSICLSLLLKAPIPQLLHPSSRRSEQIPRLASPRPAAETNRMWDLVHFSVAPPRQSWD